MSFEVEFHVEPDSKVPDNIGKDQAAIVERKHWP